MLFIPQDGSAGFIQAGSTLTLKTQMKLGLKEYAGGGGISEQEVPDAYMASWWIHDVPLKEKPTLALVLVADWTGAVGSPLKREKKVRNTLRSGSTGSKRPLISPLCL